MNTANLRERLRLLLPNRSTPARPPKARNVDGILPGRNIATSAGPVWCVEHRYPLAYRRGHLPLRVAVHVPPEGWNLWLGRDTGDAFAFESAAFVDVETTGLERGTGTYAFLIGVGRFTDDGFQVRQFFMRDYDEEPAVLEAVFKELEGVRGLFTFNGLSFDWPLLQTRATLNRLEFPDVAQLDLLYPARRLWKAVTGDCRLGRLEQEILGVQRSADVPGHLIPHLYFRYLETGDAAPLAAVIEHNRQDIVSTAALAAYVGSAMSRPLDAAPLGRPLPGTELYGIGRLLCERKEWAQGAACLEEALRRGLPGQLRRACRTLLADVHRRLGNESEAVRQWRALVDEGTLSVEPYVSLAKYYEHQAKDFARAREWTLKAIELVRRRRMLHRHQWEWGREVHGKRDREMEELVHRLRRLDAKLAHTSAHTASRVVPLQTPLLALPPR